jgi:hypothetical protein
LAAKYVKALITVDGIIGFALLCLNFHSDSLSLYNYLIFLLLVYLYSKTGHKRFIPFFIFEFFVFTLVLANRLFPVFLNDQNPFVNTSMIILGCLGVLAMLATAIRLWGRH